MENNPGEVSPSISTKLKIGISFRNVVMHIHQVEN